MSRPHGRLATPLEKEMQQFKINSLKGWEKVKPGEEIEFPAGEKGRVIKLSVNTTHRVDVWAADNADLHEAKLIAAADGMFKLEVSTSETLYLGFNADPDAGIYIHTTAQSHIVKKGDGPSYTSVEPRMRRNTEFDQMMLIMKHNEMQRQRQYDQNTARMQAQIDALTAAGGQDSAAGSQTDGATVDASGTQQAQTADTAAAAGTGTDGGETPSDTSGGS